MYEKALRETMIYRHAEYYCRCRDTFWVESFNHQLLTYIPKRVHFHSDTFQMRMNYAVMDWNENVCRPATSERMYVDLRRPDRRTPKRVLVKKTFNNVHTVWSLYVARNKVNIRPLCDEVDGQDAMAETDDVDDDIDDGDALESSDEIDDYEDAP